MINPYTEARRMAVSRCNENPSRLNQLLKENMQRRCHEWEDITDG